MFGAAYAQSVSCLEGVTIMSTDNGQDNDANQNKAPLNNECKLLLALVLIAVGVGLGFYVNNLFRTRVAVGPGLDPRGGIGIGAFLIGLLGFAGVIMTIQDMVKAKKIFKACDILSRNALWEPLADNEWRDLTGYFKYGTVTQIDDFFDDDTLYFSINRWNGELISRADHVEEHKKKLIEELEKHLSVYDVNLCDTKFKRIMKFSKDGTFRKGTLNS